MTCNLSSEKLAATQIFLWCILSLESLELLSINNIIILLYTFRKRQNALQEKKSAYSILNVLRIEKGCHLVAKGVFVPRILCYYTFILIYQSVRSHSIMHSEGFAFRRRNTWRPLDGFVCSVCIVQVWQNTNLCRLLDFYLWFIDKFAFMRKHSTRELMMVLYRFLRVFKHPVQYWDRESLLQSRPHHRTKAESSLLLDFAMHNEDATAEIFVYIEIQLGLGPLLCWDSPNI